MDDQWSTIAAFAGLVPLLLGGVFGIFRPFMVTEQDLLQRSRLLRAKLKDAACSKMAILLNHARQIDADEDLRGDGRIQPDLVEDYTQAIVKYYRRHFQLEVLRLTTRWIANGLVLTAILGLITVVIGLTLSTWRQTIFAVAVGLIIFQVLLIVCNRLLITPLVEYEEDLEHPRSTS